jgi:5S rRNA maturation endonuclease (ribonuclease M5)
VTLDELLSRFEAVKRNGAGHMARCPVHEDAKPSLSIAQGDKGLLVHCHAGCATADVLAKVGLELRDLFEEPEAAPEAIYSYLSANGKPLHEVVRLPGKNFRQRHWKSGGYVWNTRGIERVLYRLPLVLAAAKAGHPVYVVEGEKDVHALEAAGVVATTNPGGCGKWHARYAETLRGASEVIVVADKDEPGRKHAEDVLRSFEGIAPTRLVEAKVGKDAADHLAAGFAPDEFVPLSELDEPDVPPLVPIAGETVTWVPSGLVEPIVFSVPSFSFVAFPQFAAEEEEGAEPLVGEGKDVLIPVGGDGMIYGDGGSGKTTIVVDLACHLGAGDDWLGYPVPKPVNVGIIENEGSRPFFRQKIKRRLAGWQGSEIGTRPMVMDHPWALFSFAEPSHRYGLAAAIRAYELDLVIVGPITTSGMDTAGTLQDVRAFAALTAEVRRLSGRLVTFLLVHHEGRGGRVSGVWEGVGDTLFHVQAQGHGRLRLFNQKVRLGSSYHHTSLQLAWQEGDAGGFDVEETITISDDEIATAILTAIEQEPGTAWNKVEAAVPGVAATHRQKIRDALLKGGQIVNVALVDGIRYALDHCLERRTSHFYLADDPTIADLPRGPHP